LQAAEEFELDPGSSEEPDGVTNVVKTGSLLSMTTSLVREKAI
jgi:hypothetical protein